MKRGAIILCGGASTRMGRDKAWLPFGPDEVMLQRVVRLVSEAVAAENVVCVAAAHEQIPLLPESVQVVRDQELHAGPLAGLATGLAALENRADAVFATGCDVPLLVLAFVSRMFEFLGDHEIAVPHDGERYHPLAAVYRASVLPEAKSLLASGEQSLVSLVERCRTRSVVADSLRDIDPDLSSLANCNTPDDYDRLLGTSGLRN